MGDITIVLPAVDEDQLSAFLRGLTKAIAETTGANTSFGLGGSYGYGCDYNSDVFMMKPYCWCDSETCPWCMGCNCPDACGLHSKDAHQDVGFEPDYGAPNFWHKPSGFKVWWYKYIGRGMETKGDGNLIAIAYDCLADVRKDAPHAA